MRSILLIITLAVSGCCGQEPTSVVSGAPDAAELDVLVSFLAGQYAECVKSNTPLIIEDTFSSAMLYMGDESPEKFTKSLLAQASDQIPADLIRDFCTKNAKIHMIGPELGRRIPVILFSQEDMKAIFSAINAQKPDGWDRFYAKYPKSPGIITVSRVGFNRHGDIAMVYIGSQSHWLAGAGRIHILHKQGDKWTEVPAMIGPSWVS